MNVTVTLNDGTTSTITCDGWYTNETGTLVINERDQLGGNHTIALIAHGTWSRVTDNAAGITFAHVINA